MRPPDQIPNRQPCSFSRGDAAFVWTGKRYTEKTVVKQHEWEAAITLQDGIGPIIVQTKDVIDAAQYETEQREEARERYKYIIYHWSRGLRKSDEIGSLIGESARATGQIIAAAKRWGLISNDPEPSDANSAAGG